MSTLRHLPGLAVALLAAALAGCTGGSALPEPDVSHVAAADPGSALPADWARGPFMEIYVRGYQDSDGDGLGDLRGLTQRLDYLRDLGITGIWLMPVTRSEDRDHGYAVADYRDIERDYGTLADLDELLAQAHARGLGVILDYVMNHSAATNPLFLSSQRGPGDPYRGWYVWSPTHPAGWSVFGQDPWRPDGGAYYYAPFWDQMPDFDHRDPAVVEYHHDNLRFWLNRGADGFRFDAVGVLVENGPGAYADQPEDYALMADARALLDGYAARFMVCEAPDDPAGFAASCGSAFAFGHHHDLVAAAQGDAAAVAAVGRYFSSAPPRISTMLSNHDSFAGARPWDQLGGDGARYRLAAATYLLQPGIPFIYYGEEIGMAGGAGLTGDRALRAPMSWSGGPGAGFTTGTPFRALASNAATQNVSAQLDDPGSLLAFYRSLIALRRSCPALLDGSYDAPQASGLTLAFLRTSGTSHALVVLNYGASAATPSLQGLPPGTSLARRDPAGGPDLVVDGLGHASPTLPPASFQVYTW